MAIEIEDVHVRLVALEQWRTSLDITRAREETDRKHLDRRLDGIEKSINSLQDTLKWFTYTTAGAAITYLVVFALKGGFT